jgi:hypothetical protein
MSELGVFRIVSLIPYVLYVLFSVAEPHHFYAAPDPAPGKNFDAAPATLR